MAVYVQCRAKIKESRRNFWLCCRMFLPGPNHRGDQIADGPETNRVVLVPITESVMVLLWLTTLCSCGDSFLLRLTIWMTASFLLSLHFLPFFTAKERKAGGRLCQPNLKINKQSIKERQVRKNSRLTKWWSGGEKI